MSSSSSSCMIGSDEVGPKRRIASRTQPSKARLLAARRPHVVKGVAILVVILTSVILGLTLGSRGRRGGPVKLEAPITDESTDVPASSSPTEAPKALHLQHVTVGVYYYPWHAIDFHNNDGYLRNELHPPQQPVLGEYDDSDPTVITQHLEWSRQANIDLWVTSWWGPNTMTDAVTRDVILKHQNLRDMRIALHYETNGRIKAVEGFSLHRVASDIEYMCRTYFRHPNYYRIDDRPVLVIYISRYLDQNGVLEGLVQLMRETAEECGTSLYIVGDHVFREAPLPNFVFPPFQYLDAVTNYDVYGSMESPTTYAGSDKVTEYYTKQAEWRASAKAFGCDFIPAAAPGYNDRGIRLEVDHMALSRRLEGPNDAPGSLFQFALRQARELVDVRTNGLLLINSFNEWHEDTQIEPVTVTESTTNKPEIMTNGVEYVGYGELYLDILYNETIDPVHVSVN